MPDLRSNLKISLAAAVFAIAVATGCGPGTQGGDYGGEHPNYARALAGAPRTLARLHAQENRLLQGAQGAYEKRLATLRGFPIVVNVWASWCGACRFEFPIFQRLAAEYGKRVAFLGIDSQDSDDAAATFLEEVPVPYPSYTDSDGEIADSIGASRGLPDTAFYDSDGNLVYLKQGQYADAAGLRADIERYALAGETGEGR